MLALLLTSILLAMPFLTWALLWTRFSSLNTQEAKLRFGTLYQGLRTTSKPALLYHVIYMLRRLLFTAVAVLLEDSPTLQI